MFGPSDVKLHNLKATGRDRKIWHLHDLADSVWGHRPVAAKKKQLTRTKIRYAVTHKNIHLYTYYIEISTVCHDPSWQDFYFLE